MKETILTVDVQSNEDINSKMLTDSILEEGISSPYFNGVILIDRDGEEERVTMDKFKIDVGVDVTIYLYEDIFKLSFNKNRLSFVGNFNCDEYIGFKVVWEKDN